MLADFDVPPRTLAERVQHERGGAGPSENRRVEPRFSVPGSLVRVPARPLEPGRSEAGVRDLLFGFMPVLWMQRREVLNLSATGLAFESSSPIARGRRLNMQLWIPGLERPLELCGETRWCKRLLGRQYCVGIRFEPFALQPDRDAPAALDVLRQLQAKFG